MKPPELLQQKPRSTTIRPELTSLPRITTWRRLFRHIVRWLARQLAWLLTRTQVSGLENLPDRGPALIVGNHLGDADVFLGLAFSPRFVDMLAKVELYDFPLLGKLMDAYGVIWIHRGQPDRRALRAALDGLAEGRLIAIAPEGRESVTGALEEGTHGAAFLALKAAVPIIPVTFTHTENPRIYGNLRRLRRTCVTITIGPPFRLEKRSDRQSAILYSTQTIMRKLASQLPPEYQGIYQIKPEHIHDSR